MANRQAAVCHEVYLKRDLPGRSFAMQVDWLVKPDKQKRTVKKRRLVRSISIRGKPACGRHLSVLSIGGQRTRAQIRRNHTNLSNGEKRGVRWYQGCVRGGRIEAGSYWWEERRCQGYVRVGRIEAGSYW